VSGGLRYRRILLKLSGEAFAESADRSLDSRLLTAMAGEIAEAVRLGVELGIVVGGGNIIRGREQRERGIDRVTLDQMGMLATVINALALQSALEHEGLTVRVMSAVRINQVCEDFIHRRALRHLEKGRVVVFAGGTGNPFFTTDTAAALRAIEIRAQLVLKATKVDGIYDHDPALHEHASRYRHLDYDRILRDRLTVMDDTAIVLCRDNGIPLRVFDFQVPHALAALARGEQDIGTFVDSRGEGS
jgi:uridylate kinase